MSQLTTAANSKNRKRKTLKTNFYSFWEPSSHAHETSEHTANSQKLVARS